MRGSKFSQRHVSLDFNTDEYWYFHITGFSKIPVFALLFGGTNFAISLALESEFFSSRISVTVLASKVLNSGHTNGLIYAFLGNFPLLSIF
ncbi:unnamed protein product [Moneuplotes crassus]|uniref:Uncharacterized protein n=1 Tax=Euplotes crassus TaxID=5936 RepID=A0AAD1UUI4_EUPCR|nr:unnamed protein product [Moneuplotes crassus]